MKKKQPSFAKCFPNFSLRAPLFYQWEIGIRFELGSPEIGVWKDRELQILNEDYFRDCLEKASKMFDFLFQAEDDVLVVYQMIDEDNEKEEMQHFVLEQIQDKKEENILRSAIVNPYDESNQSEPQDAYAWERLEIHSKAFCINYNNLLEAIIHSDFGSREPNIWAECYFINLSQQLIFHLYDDRGMDVVAFEKKSLQNLYEKFNDWILEYDRTKIEKLFES